MAAAAFLSGGRPYEQDCARCHDPELRKEWGCDEESAEAWVTITPCPFCHGDDERCAECDGSNAIPIRRCPNTLVEDVHGDILTAAALVEHGILPDPGAWQDQAATFCQVYGVALREINFYRALAQERANKQAEAAHRTGRR